MLEKSIIYICVTTTIIFIGLFWMIDLDAFETALICASIFMNFVLIRILLWRLELKGHNKRNKE